jgi:hypothetical protein
VNSYRCPRCGQIVPAWQPVHIRCLAYRMRFLILGITAVLLLSFSVFQFFQYRSVAEARNDTATAENNFVDTGQNDNVEKPVPQQTTPAIEKSDTPSQPTKITKTKKPTSTATKKSIMATPSITKIPSLTPSPTVSSCPGAPPQRVSVGRRAWVCTKRDRLIVRSQPNRNGSEITRIEPGTYFRILNGPACANNWSWWEIKTDTGIKGWVAEGGDDIDPYFICPQGQSR